MFVVVLQGIESASHRQTLESIRDLWDDPPHMTVSLSYRSMQSRRLSAKYVEDTHARGFSVVMEGGVRSAAMSADEATRMAQDYYAFIETLPDPVVAVEFEHSAAEGIDVRHIDRVIPIWRGGDPTVLSEMLREKGSVSLAYDGDSRVPAILRRDSEDHSVMLALAQPDLAEAKKAGFNMAMTNAWTAPGKFGEISFWDGTRFHRNSSEGRDRLLSKYAHQIADAGFDVDLLRAHDSRELTRMAAWSFVKWAQSLDTSDKKDESGEGEVVPLRVVSGKSVNTAVKKTRPTRSLPVFDQDEVEGLEEDANGRATIQTRSVLRASSETVRVCDSCFLASTCPAYEPGSSCAFNFPVEVRTDAQVKSLLSAMIELQASRVAFARFAEEVNGGNPDPVVGQEMDRLFRLAEKAKKVEERRERLTVSVDSASSGGGTGMLSAIFGEKAALPAPEVDTVIAEVIEDD